MKFSNDIDAKTFLVEIGDIAKAIVSNKSYKPTNEEIGTFIKKRKGIIKKLKDYSKSRDGKLLWRRNRHKMLKAVRGFHKSVEGKRFHKKLGKFLATRITRNEDSTTDKHDALIGINSLRQHLLVELEYFHQSIEQSELENMVFENAIPILQNIEIKILSGDYINEDELAFLLDTVSNNEITKSVAILLQIEHNIITEVFSEVKTVLESYKVEKKCNTFYSVFKEVLHSNTKQLQGS